MARASTHLEAISTLGRSQHLHIPSSSLHKAHNHAVHLPSARPGRGSRRHCRRRSVRIPFNRSRKIKVDDKRGPRDLGRLDIDIKDDQESRAVASQGQAPLLQDRLLLRRGHVWGETQRLPLSTSKLILYCRQPHASTYITAHSQRQPRASNMFQRESQPATTGSRPGSSPACPIYTPSLSSLPRSPRHWRSVFPNR